MILKNSHSNNTLSSQPSVYINRCEWVPHDKDFYIAYHDEEWGIPVHDDPKHFEMLTLEGAQAGLNWETILKKRKAYQATFYNFDPKKVALMSDEDLENALNNPDLIRNRLKIFSVRKNAQAFLNIQKNYGNFDHYIWQFVNYQPIINQWKTLKAVPASTPLSHTIAKDLKKWGFSFVGPTITYAYMQAIGLVNDHLSTCSFKYKNPTP